MAPAPPSLCRERARPPRQFRGSRAEIVIDGKLDEPVWSRATRLTGFWQYQPVDGRPAEDETEILAWYAPDAIYFGIIAHDRNPSSIRATVADRDNIDNDDYVVLDLDTFHDRRRAFFFAVNPLGVQSDGVRSEGSGQVSSLIPGSTDVNPDYTWDSKGRITDRGYEVEIRIPFRNLRYRGSGPQTWGFNATRMVQRTGYTNTWTDVRRASASFLGQEGALGGLHDLRHGVTVEAQPFVTATANGSRGCHQRGVPPRRRESGCRPEPPPGVQQLRARRHRQPRLQPGRERRGTGDGERALRPLLPGEATLLSGGDRAVRLPPDAGVHPPHRGSQGRRQAHRQVRPAGRGAPDGGG